MLLTNVKNNKLKLSYNLRLLLDFELEMLKLNPCTLYSQGYLLIRILDTIYFDFCGNCTTAPQKLEVERQRKTSLKIYCGKRRHSWYSTCSPYLGVLNGSVVECRSQVRALFYRPGFSWACPYARRFRVLA